MLGCVARIYQAHLEGDGGLNATDRKFFMNYAEGSHGRGFVSAVEEWFPELSETTLRSAMNEALRMNLTCAQRELEACLVLFQSSCGCSSCGQGGRLQSHGCYLAIAATLIDLISMLSAVVIKHEEMIWPTFAGLRYFFAINSAKMHERDTSTSDRCHRILYKRRAKEMYDHDDITKRLEFIVEEVLHLFTGMAHAYPNSRGSESTRRTRTAISSEGICVFAEGIRALSTRPETMRCMRIIPGRIAKFNPNKDSIAREYDTISDARWWSQSTMDAVSLSSYKGISSRPDAEVDNSANGRASCSAHTNGCHLWNETGR
jgi:hypothetical protein